MEINIPDSLRGMYWYLESTLLIARLPLEFGGVSGRDIKYHLSLSPRCTGAIITASIGLILSKGIGDGNTISGFMVDSLTGATVGICDDDITSGFIVALLLGDTVEKIGLLIDV